ncbi:MAG: iron-containing redox enzyme family protein [Firmicutes bacterium]|nr:iron-containing redox enzyme family protein [Bacillota bacterium]
MSVAMPRTLDEVEDAMKTYVAAEFLAQPFFQTLSAGAWDRQFLQYFAAQYAHYSAHFPRILGAAIAAMEPCDAWWIPLADNLWDEAGRGRPGASHACLYRTFWASVDPSVTGWYEDMSRWPPISSAVRGAVDAFLEFFRSARPLEAMAAVGLGSEFFAGEVMGAIAQGLRHPAYQREGVIDTTFWDVHAQHDEPRHYALCRDVLLDYATEDAWPHLLAIGKEIAHTEANMYRGLFIQSGLAR